jgi:cytochrome c551/c552
MIMNRFISKTGVLLVAMAGALLLYSCGSSQTDDAGNTTSGNTTEGPALADSLTNKGIGPVTEVELGPLDAAMAVKGKGIFESKCATCHKFDVKYVGPPLQTITKRRTPEWIMNQMLNPEKMIKEDPIAKSLFERYLVPMTFQNLSHDDARAILEYFREKDAQ